MARNEKWLSRKLQEKGAVGAWHFYTFENCGYPYVPDLHGVAPGGSCWIELKAIPTRHCKIPFRKGQPSWIAAHAARGGKVWVLVLVQEDDELWLLKGDLIQVWHSAKLALLPLGSVVAAQIPLKGPTPLLSLSERL